MLSNSVSNASKLTGGPEVERTVQFVVMLDKMFDCLNVASLDAGKFTRNPIKLPYHSAKDFRIKVFKIVDARLLATCSNFICSG